MATALRRLLPFPGEPGRVPAAAVRTSGLLVAGPANVTLQGMVGHPRTDPFALCVDAALLLLAVSYAAGVRRDPPRDAGARAAAVSYACGLLCLYLSLGSGFAADQVAHPSVDVAQHVLLMMVAPPLLVLGRPRRAVPLELGTVRTVWRAMSGVASWPLYYGSMAAYFLTPCYGASLHHPVLLDATQMGFVVVGLLFWAGLVGQGRGGLPRSSAFRLAAVIGGMPVETAMGLALVLWPRPLTPGETLAGTHAAGLLLWLASMFTSGVALAVLLVQWCVADSRAADGHDAFAFPAIPTRSDAGAGRSSP
jgi:cytochrome c oxidase assembly factor CtaG